MSLKKYLKEIGKSGLASEAAFYTPLSVHILMGLRGYSAKTCLINKAGAAGIADVRLLSEGETRAFRPHRIWRNLERYIRKMDVEAIREKVGL